jgi:AcrR family transcriptional regulator
MEPNRTIILVDDFCRSAINPKGTNVRFINELWADCPAAAAIEQATMPRLKPDTQRLRREHILDAAERCFAHAGFHNTSMQDICRDAGVSPGALYVYFKSKEDLIAGLAERDRQEFQARFAQLAEAPDFFEALRGLGESYFVEDPAERHRICIEVALESTRNEKVGEIHRSVDALVRASFEQLFERMQREGRIAPDLDTATCARVFMIIGDGMFFRRAVDPDFNARATLPGIVALVRDLLKPVASHPAEIHQTLLREARA